MPLKLPAPDFGTDEHAGPKSVVVDAEPEGAIEGAAELAAAFGAELDVPEVLPEPPHAAAPMATLAARTDPARRR
jgi:predicted phosphoribosyltransferase